MTIHENRYVTADQNILRVPTAHVNLALKSFLALFNQWQARRNMARELGQLSDTQLRDIGLTKADVEFAYAHKLDQYAGNW